MSYYRTSRSSRSRLFESTESEVAQLRIKFLYTELSANPKSENNIAEQLKKLILDARARHLDFSKPVLALKNRPDGKKLYEKI